MTLCLFFFAGNISAFAQANYTLNGLAELQLFTTNPPSSKETVNNLTVAESAGTAIPEAEIFKIVNRVEKITGTLTLQGLSLLTTTVGLIDAIDCREAGFVFRDCPELVDMNAFSSGEAYSIINGDFILENCPKAATGGATAYNDRSFSKIKEVKGDFKLIGITSQMNKQEKILPFLERVEGDFVIQNCTRLYYFTNGDNTADMPLRYIGGDLILKSNGTLQRLNGFDDLTYIGGGVSILDNGGIPNGSTDDAVTGYCKIKYYQMAGIIKNNADVQLGKTGNLIDMNTLSPCPYEIVEDVDGTFTATPANKFLSSIGVNTAINTRGENVISTREIMQYIGARWIRTSLGGNANGANPISETSSNNSGGNSIATYKYLYDEAGIRFSAGLGAGGKESNIPVFISNVKRLITAADPDILIAVEGNNEPNNKNWYIMYNGEKGGGATTVGTNWKPVARMQKQFYEDIKADPVLGTDSLNYPVWDLSYGGACGENVGLQYLRTPEDDMDVPAEFRGVTFADAVNLHNYFSHPNFQAPQNNQTWRAAEPTTNVPPGVDVLYRHYGKTWLGGYSGYRTDEELRALPRVTTETGATISGNVTEEMQAQMYLSLYLSQFKQGFEYTAMYLLTDRRDESGNQSFGFYDVHYSPRLSAHYLHNLTSILADSVDIETPASLTYSIKNRTINVHDLLLQKQDETFELVIWGENYKGGSDNIELGFDKEYDEVWIYDPSKGTLPVRILKNVRTIQLEMTNHPYIIEIGNHPDITSIQSPTVSQTINLFPNPVKENLTVYSGERIRQIHIFDALGKRAYQQMHIFDKKVILDLSHLQGGTYIMNLTGESNKIEKRKFIKM
jgi:hypothetical protein